MAELEGRTVFIEGALPGEHVRARVDTNDRVWRGELLEVLQPSSARRAPTCAVADRCGGCDWLHVDEPLQREAKEEIVLSALEHLGQFQRSDFELLPTLVSPQPMGYRRRAVLHFAKDQLGFYAKGTHECLPIASCPAMAEGIADLPGRLAPLLQPLKRDAEAVHLLSAGGRAAIAAFLRGPVKPRHTEAVERALRGANLEGAVLVPQEGSPTLVGRPVLRTPAPLAEGAPLFLRPDAFTQANEAANEGLVRAAIEQLEPRASDHALELYSGNGNFTFALAARAASVLAVESGAVSVELARRSVAEGKVSNVRFVLGDARKVAEGLVTEGKKFDLLLVDPPRAGAPGVARWAKKLGARRVVYVACDPASLARDGAELRDAGYTPRKLQLVDMFPQTRHVEAVMSFEASGLQ